MADERDVTAMGDLVRAKRKATISINGGPEVPVDVIRCEGDRLAVREETPDPVYPLLPEQGVEMSVTGELTPGSYEWLIRHSLGEFNA